MEELQTSSPVTPSFESVWAGLQEERVLMKELRESHKEFSVGMKELKESQKETDRLIKELRESHKESKLEYDRRIGHLDNLFGEISEYMIAPKMCEKFNELGFDLQRSSRNSKIKDYKNNIHFEIDVMLENGDIAILVEIKAKMTANRIVKHIERLEKMRKYADLHGDKRTFLGAIAGIAIADEEKKHALEQGFYVIEPTGDNFFITSPEGNPKEW